MEKVIFKFLGSFLQVREKCLLKATTKDAGLRTGEALEKGGVRQGGERAVNTL